MHQVDFWRVDFWDVSPLAAQGSFAFFRSHTIKMKLVSSALPFAAIVLVLLLLNALVVHGYISGRQNIRAALQTPRTDCPVMHEGYLHGASNLPFFEIQRRERTIGDGCFGHVEHIEDLQCPCGTEFVEIYCQTGQQHRNSDCFWLGCKSGSTDFWCDYRVLCRYL